MNGMKNPIRSDGFDFDFVERNKRLESLGFKPPVATSTGTTIIGVVYKDGVVLGADTRATMNTIVADKNCEKIHYLTSNIYCCGAGTAADTHMVTLMASSTLAIHELNMRRRAPVVTASTYLKRHLFKYQGYIGAALILGGVDDSGPHLYAIYPHGNEDVMPFVTMGSGSLAAMSVLETQYRPNMTKEEAMEIVVNGISAGIFNDLGSGSNIDLVVISQTEGTSVLRNYIKPNEKEQKHRTYVPSRGSTIILSETVKYNVDVGHVSETVSMMDLS